MISPNRDRIGSMTRIPIHETAIPAGRAVAHPKPPTSVAAWLILVGIFTPYIQMEIGGLVFTPARLTITVFFLPAIVAQFGSSRGWKSPDFFAIATAAWMIISSLFNDGFQAYVGAQALEFLSAYLIGRAYFGDQPGLLIRLLKTVSLIVISLGFLDTLAGYPVTLSALGLNQFQVDYRNGLLRADSVFPVAELFGAFCVASTFLFLYCEPNRPVRIFYVLLSVLGVAASLSSGPLLGLVVGLGAFAYDVIMNRWVWRWKLLVWLILGSIVGSYAVLNDPIAAIVGHLTFNPDTGNFRIVTWTLGLEQVAKYPIFGRGLASFDGESDLVKMFVGKSVDALWLVLMLRYGIPVVVLLLLSIFVPMLWTNRAAVDLHLARVRTGFSFAVILMALIGLTVHYWDAIWIFFALCIGIRASLAEPEPQSRNHRGFSGG